MARHVVIPSPEQRCTSDAVPRFSDKKQHAAVALYRELAKGAPVDVANVEPATAAVSFLLPDPDAFAQSAGSVMSNFCHLVFFFASRESGVRWADTRAHTFLYSVEEAFELGQRFTERCFGAALRSGA